MEDYDEAITCLKEIENTSDSAVAYYLIGISYYAKEFYETSYLYFEKTIKAEPSNLDAYFYFVSSAILSNKEDNALSTLFSLKGKVDEDVINLFVSYIFLSMGKVQEAYNYLSKINEESPLYYKALYLKGFIFYSQSNYKKAYEYFKKSYLLNPLDPYVSFMLSKTMHILNLKDWNKYAKNEVIKELELARIFDQLTKKEYLAFGEGGIRVGIKFEIYSGFKIKPKIFVEPYLKYPYEEQELPKVEMDLERKKNLARANVDKKILKKSEKIRLYKKSSYKVFVWNIRFNNNDVEKDTFKISFKKEIPVKIILNDKDKNLPLLLIYIYVDKNNIKVNYVYLLTPSKKSVELVNESLNNIKKFSKRIMNVINMSLENKEDEIYLNLSISRVGKG